MTIDIKDKDVETWILLHLYQEPDTIENMVEFGCQRMILDRPLEKLRQTLIDLVQKNFININDQYYSITLEGKFLMKQTIFRPYFKLERDQIALLMHDLNDECDTRFLKDILKNVGNDVIMQKEIISWAFKYLPEILNGLSKMNELFNI